MNAGKMEIEATPEILATLKKMSHWIWVNIDLFTVILEFFETMKKFEYHDSDPEVTLNDNQEDSASGLR